MMLFTFDPKRPKAEQGAHAALIQKLREVIAYRPLFAPVMEGWFDRLLAAPETAVEDFTSDHYAAVRHVTALPYTSVKKLGELAELIAEAPTLTTGAPPHIIAHHTNNVTARIVWLSEVALQPAARAALALRLMEAAPTDASTIGAIAAKLPEADQRRVMDLVTGMQELDTNPATFRRAIRVFIRERLGLADLVWLADAATSMLASWARAAGTERPTFARGRKAGTPWRFDNSNLNWTELIPQAERTDPSVYLRPTTNARDLATIRAYVTKRAAAEGIPLGTYVATVVIPQLQHSYKADVVTASARALFAAELADAE